MIWVWSLCCASECDDPAAEAFDRLDLSAKGHEVPMVAGADHRHADGLSFERQLLGDPRCERTDRKCSGQHGGCDLLHSRLPQVSVLGRPISLSRTETPDAASSRRMSQLHPVDDSRCIMRLARVAAVRRNRDRIHRPVAARLCAEQRRFDAFGTPRYPVKIGLTSRDPGRRHGPFAPRGGTGVQGRR